MRTTPIFGIALAIASATYAVEAEPVHEIEITADVPTVTVLARRLDQTTILLPNLTYALSVTADCDADWQPNSVLVSVADSSATLGIEQLRVSTEQNLELRIPANQIAPLRIEQFCVDADDLEPETAGSNRIKISGVMSAQASLRCIGESTHSIEYVTVPLDLVLECAETKQPDDTAPTRQSFPVAKE